MFRIILLMFIFIYFNGNFFYSFVINYIPFKHAQNINIYDINNVFDSNIEFKNFMLDSNIEFEKFINIGSLKEINIYKTTQENFYIDGIILELPFKSNFRFGERQEIFIPIIEKEINSVTGLTEDNIIDLDKTFDEINLINKNQIIKDGFSYLDYGIDYKTFDENEDINNLDIKYENKKAIFLNKLYIIKTIDEGNNINFLIR